MGELTRRYGDFPSTHADLDVSERYFEFWSRKARRRRGEILLVARREDGRILLHTKDSYPLGVYRLPTGGIEAGEPVWEALYREIDEETGYPVENEQFLGVVTYDFRFAGSATPFASYLFYLDRVPGDPVVTDLSEGITGFQWLLQEELPGVADGLEQLAADSPTRPDWGRFRAVAHRFVAEQAL